jgi:hypothetical protein
MNEQVKIIKLQSGEDLIGIVQDNGDTLKISEPMVFEFQSRNGQSRVIMTFFLPEQLLENNEVEISKDDILYMVNPNQGFIIKYKEAMEKFFIDDEEINMKQLMIQAFLELDPEEKIIH